MLGLENTKITNKSYNATVSYRTSMSLIKNLQQITMAIYMVTDCVEEGEPLRYQAREAVLKAMAAITNVLGNIQTNSNQFRIAHAQMILVREHINILEIMGFVSTMNASILVAEIDRFISSLDTSILDTDSPHNAHVSMRNDMSYGVDLGELFYNKNDQNSGANSATNSPRQARTFDKNDGGDNSGYNGKNTIHPTLKGTPQEGNSVQGNSLNNSFIKLENQMGRLKRRTLILKLFRELPSPSGKKELTLNELVDKYSRYGGEGIVGEKTIQRELLEMTQDGTLEKLGTKRWVKYRLVHS